MKSTIAAAIAALLLPLPVAAWENPYSKPYNSSSFDSVYRANQQSWEMQRLQQQQRRQDSGFYQTRYQCGNSFYQCR